jgi:hypothetical protein
MINLRASLRRSRATALVALAGLMVFPAITLAQDDNITFTIEKHAQLTAGGAVIITIHIACDPLPGTEDFQEGLAGASQAKTGAEAEGGINGPVVCDGLSRTYTAHLSPFTDVVFKPGPAGANAGVTICNNVGDQQVCVHGGAGRRIIIHGPRVP